MIYFIPMLLKYREEKTRNRVGGYDSDPEYEIIYTYTTRSCLWKFEGGDIDPKANWKKCLLHLMSAVEKKYFYGRGIDFVGAYDIRFVFESDFYDDESCYDFVIKTAASLKGSQV